MVSRKYILTVLVTEQQGPPSHLFECADSNEKKNIILLSEPDPVDTFCRLPRLAWVSEE